MRSERPSHDLYDSASVKRRLASDTAWMVSGYGARIVLQAGYFLLLARSLGSSEYGAFVSTVVLIAIGAPLAGLGVGHILVRDASRTPELLRTALADALTVSAVGGVALVAFLLPFLAAIAPSNLSLQLLVFVLLADGVGGPLAEVCAQAFQAAGRIRVSAFLQFSPSALRFAAVVWFSSRAGEQGLGTWTAAYATAGIVAALVAVAIATYAFRPSRPRIAGALGMAREGWYFSIMAAAQMANSDADKPLVARLSSVEAAGVYAAAYRIVDVAFSPVRALMYSSYASFFAHGALGVRRAMSFAGGLARLSVGYSLLFATALWLSAPLLPFALGESFQPSVDALRWLAPLLPARALQVVAADALASTGFYSLRATCSVAIVVLNVSLNLALIGSYSWRGAAAAALVSDFALAAILWSLLFLLRGREDAKVHLGRQLHAP